MKQALVLGLAFTANAMSADQADNELLVAPSGGKFSDFAKLPHRLGRMMFDEQADDELFVAPQGKLADLAKKYPGMIMFDEVADDELAVALPPRSAFKSDEEYKKMVAGWRNHWDDAADDELIIAPTDEFGNIKQYPRNIRFDEQADDELLIRPIQAADDDEFIAVLLPREKFSSEEEYQKYVAKMRFHRDDADDELLIRPVQAADDDEFIVMLLPREKFSSEEEYQKYVAKMRFYRDDELIAINNKKPFEESKHAILCRNKPNHPFCGGSHYETKKALEADDELFVAPQGKLADLAKKYPGMIMFDEVADDELVAINNKKPFEESKHGMLCRSYPDHPWCGGPKKPLVKPSQADDEELFYVPGMRIQDIVHRDDAADDELSVIPKAPRVFGDKHLLKSAKLPMSEALIRDDEGDDELVYLGSLIKHAEKITDVHTFDDDELRGEKSSHAKAQERNQFKSELPKMKRKLRPADETAFLA